MVDFSVTKETIAKISEQFSVPREMVTALHSFFDDITKGIKGQYLAHIIRTMEEKLRRFPGNEMFQIICSPVDAKGKQFGIASAHYYKARYFSIFYHPQTDDTQLRIMLAHELGHLFLIAYLNEIQKTTKYNTESKTEPLSTILGIFTILDKNDFYHNKTALFKHPSVQAVLDDFRRLSNLT
jgi:Zn-dependent peptidase ImmA (M78 family)